MKKMPNAKRLVHLDAISRNKRSQEAALASEMLLYRLSTELVAWIDEPHPELAFVRDKYTLAVMRMLKDIYNRSVVTTAVSKALSSVLTALGFSEYIAPLESSSRSSAAGGIVDDRRLSFDFIKLVKSKTNTPIYQFMKITEDPTVWQLRLFGEFMDRSMDSQPDSRVSFHPDAWQRDVLDCIDEGSSLLVVGPSSPLIFILP